MRTAGGILLFLLRNYFHPDTLRKNDAQNIDEDPVPGRSNPGLDAIGLILRIITSHLQKKKTEEVRLLEVVIPSSGNYQKK